MSSLTNPPYRRRLAPSGSSSSSCCVVVLWRFVVVLRRHCVLRRHRVVSRRVGPSLWHVVVRGGGPGCRQPACHPWIVSLRSGSDIWAWLGDRRHSRVCPSHREGYVVMGIVVCCVVPCFRVVCMGDLRCTRCKRAWAVDGRGAWFWC